MSVTRPRGPLPAHVYWVRRVLVLGVAAGLVAGGGALFGGLGDDPGTTPAAVTTPLDSSSSVSPAAAPGRPTGGSTHGPSADPGAAAPSSAPRTQGGEQRPGRRKRKERVPLAEPSGPCQDSDVLVEPVLRERAYAGSDVRLTLRLTTQTTPACTWTVSPKTVAVRLTSGSDRIWSSQECPEAVPTEEVVVREAAPTFVDMTWVGRRSDPDCSRTTLWAEPGYYHVATAALGGDPAEKQFRLRPPAPVTITPTPTPRADGKDRRDERPDGQPDESQDGQPGGQPGGQQGERRGD